MPRARRPSQDITALEGGPTHKKRAGTNDARVEQPGFARIRVAAGPAPAFVGEGDTRGPLDSLFEAVGQVQGPFFQKMLGERNKRYEAEATKAALEGATLDDVADENSVWQTFFKGAQGKKHGADFLSQQAARIDENRGDPLFDADADTSAALAAYLDGIEDPDVRANAIMTIGPSISPMLAEDAVARREAAQDEAVELSFDTFGQQTAGLDWRADPEAAVEMMGQGMVSHREDMAKLPNFDNGQWANRMAGLIISNARDAGTLAPFEVAEKKLAHGGTLYTSKEGDRLRSAHAALRSTLESARSSNITAQKNAQWFADDEQSEGWETPFSRKDLFARTQLDSKTDPLYISASRAESLRDNQDKVIAERKELVGDVVDLGNNVPVTDPKRLYKATEEIIQNLQKAGVEDAGLHSEVRLTAYALSGTVPTDFKENINSRFKSGQPALVRGAAEEAQRLRKFSPNLYHGTLDDSGEQAMVLFDTMNMLNIDEQTQDSWLTSDARRDIPKMASALRASKPLRDQISSSLDDLGVTGGTTWLGDNGLGNRKSVERHLIDTAAFLMAVGNYTEGAAIDAATRGLGSQLVDVGHGQRVLASQVPAGMASPTIRDEWNEQYLKRVLNNKGFDPDLADGAAISPSPSDPTRVGVTLADGTYIGDLNWSNFAQAKLQQLHSTGAFKAATAAAVAEQNERQLPFTTQKKNRRAKPRNRLGQK